ncbi:hypothetical protein QTP88_002562 [Uroleucon formosanum]
MKKSLTAVNNKVSENLDYSGIIANNIDDNESAKKFIHLFTTVTNTSYIFNFELQNPTKVIFHKYFICHHTSKKKSTNQITERNTGCLSSIDILLKKNNKNTRKNDDYLKYSPPLNASIKIVWTHNHVIDSCDALKFFRTKSEANNVFLEYFKNGLSPSEAKHLHENKLLVQENLCNLLANANINPTMRHVYYLHDEWRKDNFGPDMNLIQTAIVVTPDMKIAQDMKFSREIIFIDSGSSSVDTTNNTITNKLSPSKAGAIPLAIMIHEGQTEESYIGALSLLQNNFPNCFGGMESPLVFMTDDSAAEINSLSKLWPKAKQFLCHFHMCQAEWRWLHDSKNGINLNNRLPLMKMKLQAMYSMSEEEFKNIDSHIKNKAPTNFIKRFKKNSKRQEQHSQTKRLYDKLCSKMIDFNISDLKQMNESTYAISSMTTKNVTYFIDTENGACTCKMRHAGSFCKHQAWIHKHIKEQIPNSHAVTLKERHELAMLALGIEKCPKPTFFLGLKESILSNLEIICETLKQPVNNSEYCENNECITNETTTSNEILNVPQDIDTYTQIRHTDDIINSNISVVQSEWSRLQNMIPTLPEPILDKLGYRLKNITNYSQFASFMYSLSIKSSNINKRRGQIKVQPTSLGHRKKSITRGSRTVVLNLFCTTTP